MHDYLSSYCASMTVNACVIGLFDKLQGIIIIIIFQIVLVADTIRYGLLLTATTHRRITSFSRVALSSYSTSSYSFGGDDDDDDDDDVGEEEEEDYEDDVDGIDEMDDPKIKTRAKWTDDLVTLR